MAPPRGLAVVRYGRIAAYWEPELGPGPARVIAVVLLIFAALGHLALAALLALASSSPLPEGFPRLLAGAQFLLALGAGVSASRVWSAESYGAMLAIHLGVVALGFLFILGSGLPLYFKTIGAIPAVIEIVAGAVDIASDPSRRETPPIPRSLR